MTTHIMTVQFSTIIVVRISMFKHRNRNPTPQPTTHWLGKVAVAVFEYTNIHTRHV